MHAVKQQFKAITFGNMGNVGEYTKCGGTVNTSYTLYVQLPAPNVSRLRDTPKSAEDSVLGARKRQGYTKSRSAIVYLLVEAPQ